MTTPRDGNNTPCAQAVLNTTGTSLVTLVENMSNKRLYVSDGSSGSDQGPANVLRDGNFVPGLMAVSSVDGITPVALYADSSGYLLIDSM